MPDLSDGKCLSLADGFNGACPIVREHNRIIGANEEDILKIPDELIPEFERLTPTISSLGRAFELGLVYE